MRKSWRKFLALLLAFSMVASFTATGWALETGSSGKGLKKVDPSTLNITRLGQNEEADEEEAEPIHGLNDIVRVSIVLDEPSTLEMGYSTQNIADNASAMAYRHALKAGQDAMAAKISKEVLDGQALDVKWNITLAGNIISANVPYGKIAGIQMLPGVSEVVLENRYEPAAATEADASPNMLSAREMTGTSLPFAGEYTGAGSKLAIIDTGLDIEHQSFDASAFDYAIAEDAEKAGKTVADYNLLDAAGISAVSSELNSKASADSAYLNTKVPYIYNYVDENYNVTHINDQQGEHGSHVAGISTANRYLKDGESFVDAGEKVGVIGQAPDAQIYVMKVFGAGGGAYDSDYMVAIEDALILGADSVNLSLGSSAPGISTVSASYQRIFKLLESGDMVVSISMGNNTSWDSNKQLYADDINYYTGGSPGSYTNALTVASIDDSGKNAPFLLFNDELELRYLEGGGNANNAPMTSVAGTYEFFYLDSFGANEDGSSQFAAFADEVKGKIALCNRGTSSFFQKANGAVEAGAVATIIVNNQPGTISMALDGYLYTNPCVAIKQSEGAAIKAIAEEHTANGFTYYTGKIVVGGTDNKTPMAFYEMSSFSSWGVPGSLILKPEITAPGGSVLSLNGYHQSETQRNVFEGGHDAYENMSGTSMAAPQITGLTAVIGEYYRANDIKARTGLTLRQFAQSLLMSTAVPVKEEEGGGNYYSVLKQGAGLADVNAAVGSSTFIIMDEAATRSASDGKVKAELGDRPERDGKYEYSFTITNFGEKDVTYELTTDLFTQALSADKKLLTHQTAALDADVTYAWVVEGNNNPYDVDKDGDTDNADAQAILDCLTGKVDAEELDLTVADLDGDESVTTFDAHLLLAWLAEDHELTGYVVPAGGKATVTVTIALTADQIATLDAERPCAYVEGYTILKGDDEITHSIPILAVHGSWTDASMFDAVTYTEKLYGSEQSSYFNANNTNLLSLQYNGGTATTNFSGNPYKVEEEFPADRLALNNSTNLYQINYTPIRNVANNAAAILDEDNSLLYMGSLGGNVTGAYYNTQATNPSWQNTTTRTAALNKTVGSLGLSDGDKFTVGAFAVPEYYVWQANGNDTASTMNAAQFQELLESGKLGKGAFIGYTFTVDNKAPEILDAVLSEDGSTITVTAKDDQYIAYLALLNTNGKVEFASIVPEQAGPGETATWTIDVSNMNVGNAVTVFVGDYACNEDAVMKVIGDGPILIEKDVYVLTNTMEAGKDYLITNTNAAGSAFALTRSNTSVRTDAVTIKADGERLIIEEDDVDATSIWTASEGFRLQNGGYYLRQNRGNINISTSNSGNVWSWDGENNRLSIPYNNSTRYMRFANNNFSLNTAVNSVYLFERTTETEEFDPNLASEVKVTPAAAELFTGNTLQLQAEVLPMTLDNKTVTWSSSDETIATVDETGLVTAVGAGTATITAASNKTPAVTGTATITVKAVTPMKATVNAQLVDANGANFVKIDLSDMSTQALGDAAGTHFGGGRSDDIIIGFQADGNIIETDITDNGYDSYILGSFGTTAYNARDGAHIPDVSAVVEGQTITEEYISVFVAGSYLLLFTPDYSITGWNLSGYSALAYAGTDTATGEHYYFALNGNGQLLNLVLGVDEEEPIAVDEETGERSLNLVLSTTTATPISGLPFGATYMSMSVLQTADNYGVLIANTNTREIYFVDLTKEASEPLTAQLVAGFTGASSLTTLYNDDFDTSVVPLADNDFTARIRDEIRGSESVRAQRFGDLSTFGQNAAGGTNAFTGTAAVRAPYAAPAAAEVGEPDAENKTVITVTDESTNGLYTLTYDTEALTLAGVEANVEFWSCKDNEGTVTFDFAAAEAAEAEFKLTFEAKTCEDTELELITKELGETLEPGDPETLTIEGAHIWGEPTWEWAEDFSTATATFTCERDESHTETVEATITVTSEDGKLVYTATVTGPDGKEYTDTKTAEGLKLIVEDKTNGKATTDLDPETVYTSGSEVTFAVTCDEPCLLALKNDDGTYTVLPCTDADGAHTFTVTFADADLTVVIALKGDANLDGEVNTKDATLVKQVYLATAAFETDEALQNLTGDATGDGKITTKDSTLIKQVYLELNTLNW